jgi:putative endonuclease
MIGLIYRVADGLCRRCHPEDHGRIGEDLAHRYLRSHGRTMVARNDRAPSGGGEIDIEAWHGDQLVFVAVNTRAAAEFGEPAAAVDREKRDRVMRAARDYLRRADRVRFDVVSIVLQPQTAIE